MDTIQEESNFSLNNFLEMAKYQNNFYKRKNKEIIIEIYLFLAIKLKDKNYSETDIANI